MAEGIGEHESAAFVNQLGGSLIALLAFGDTGLQDRLNAELSAGVLGGVDEVEVVGGVLVMQENKSGLQSGGLGGGFRSGLSGGLGAGLLRLRGGLLGGSGSFCLLRAAGGHSQAHHDSQKKRDGFFHVFLLHKTLLDYGLS